MAIGQGELLVTPLQLCNLTCIIANDGYVFTPHIIKEIEGEDNMSTEKINININQQYLKYIQNGMRMAFSNNDIGSCHAMEIKSIKQCGKTGTTQNPHGEDHSMFIGYAPETNPEIAIVVIVEEGGWGAKWAAPIASLLMEKYINDRIERNKLSEYICNTKINE